ncbi:MAG: hypothetical protein ACYTFM_04665 [Planctomycetota bacterium]|jgi:hypothetical protein
MEMVKSEKIIKEDEFGEYCEIQLAGKKYPGIAKIDPEQFERIGSHKWYLKVGTKQIEVGLYAPADFEFERQQSDHRPYQL